MKYVFDILFGMLGYLLAMLVAELVKDQWKPRDLYQWIKDQFKRRPYVEVLKELMKGVKRPKPPERDDVDEHLAKYDEAVQLVKRATRKRPVLKPGRRYSVQEILAAARAEKAPTKLSEAIKTAYGGQPPTPRQGFA